jgi:hypothetical protein
MKTITIGLSTTKKFNCFSWAIKKLLKTPYSHAYLRLHDDLTNNDMIYQASGLHVNFENINDFINNEIIVKEFPLQVDDDTYTKIISFCEQKVGKPYAIRNIFAIFIYMITGKKLLKGDGSNKFICSELVGGVLEICGLVNKATDLDYFTPKNVDITMSNV